MTQRIADGEITRLRAELAKVTWQRNEARADLAASQAECERLSSMIDHQRDEAMEMERMLRAELADSQSECGRLRDALEKIADWNGCYGPFPESNNELWRGMAIVTARQAARSRQDDR